ncbi:MAG: helix-turn-helix transcriptional regulator [Chitinophaga sp.]|uniref:helix-turn-helix domain-containing protein n=1 Tax=Chitinophaga sp. TaxID=1869181 RepID=UPI0025BF048F|nr:helix-turn-helix transcriptional regulator [Chitinophaga sp.]MBV8252385.1 helix-turn-helix transcriptional regulator [Chitinophaga sp.]
MHFLPSPALAPFIKNYTLVKIDTHMENVVFYPSGYVDFAINFSSGGAATGINGVWRDTPAIELLGHLTLPTRLTVLPGTVVLIARLYPHASAVFFPIPAAEFTNYATDLQDVWAKETLELYDRLMAVDPIEQKISVLEAYLLEKLRQNEKQLKKMEVVQQLCTHLLKGYDHFDLTSLAQDSGMSERNIQKLFLNNVGISPASFVSVVRFNKSLAQVLNTNASLTDIAYECGYYDQAHFIREFRKFTDITPSAARRSPIKGDTDLQQVVNIGF